MSTFGWIVTIYLVVFFIHWIAIYRGHMLAILRSGHPGPGRLLVATTDGFIALLWPGVWIVGIFVFLFTPSSGVPHGSDSSQ